MKTSDKILFDTNVLVYNADADSVYYPSACKFHEQAAKGEIKAVVASQNLLEFAAVMANSKKIVKPLTAKVVAKEIRKYQGCGCFEVIYPNAKTLEYFCSLLKNQKLSDPRKSFDFFLAATMLGNGVTKILTANEKDFMIKGIEVIKLNLTKTTKV